MSNLAKLALFDDENLTLHQEPSYRCVVEAPRGSSVKIKYSPELKAFVMGRALVKGLTYPFDWGFFPSTLGEDGDPLDVMVMHDDVCPSGVVISAQVIGVLETLQRDKGDESIRNDRFLAVPVHSHRQDDLQNVDQLSKRMREELQRFFVISSGLEGRKLEFLGWRGPRHAKTLLDEGVKRFNRSA
jgi:inorganic pyrophosphatase